MRFIDDKFILLVTMIDMYPMFVCLCKAVTDHQIKEAVETGVSSFDDMQNHLSVGTACGGCTCEVKRIIEQKLKSELSSRIAITGTGLEARV